jgi:UDP-N-acetylmuramate: L-alanyl-gamma-D-glutamyl-meso-diaminopimelate ligase
VSGPQWLADHVLQGRCAGRGRYHGKTTTSSMLAWVLEHAGMSPGFDRCAAEPRCRPAWAIRRSSWSRPTNTTAFFDKRSKFVHYRPHRDPQQP